MNPKELLQLDEQYLIQGAQPYPFALQSAEGLRLTSVEGQVCLDFSSGMGAYSLGQGGAAGTDAILEQLLQYTYAAPALVQEPVMRLAETLCQRSGMASACFLSSGKEALRLMLTAARARSMARYGAGRSRILHVAGEVWEDADYVAVPADMEALRAQRTQGVCAVLLESCPLRDACTPLSRQFVHELTIFCVEQDWLLLVDETLSGAGRTGSLFAFQQYGVLPDLLCFSSSIAGGLPLGGVLVGTRCREALTLVDAKAFAFGANPLSAVAATSVLDALNEDVMAQAREKGAYLRQGIEALQLSALESVCGSGLLLGLRLREPHSIERWVAQLLVLGLLCMPTEHALLLLPPLTVQQEELDAAIQIIERQGLEPPLEKE